MMKRFRNTIKNWIGREGGAISIEFVSMFPMAVVVLFAAGESTFVNGRKTQLDMALESTIRDLRLGLITSPTATKVRDAICAKMPSIDNCASNLTLELNVRNNLSGSAAISMPALTDLCVNRQTNVTPVLNFGLGTANDLVLVRACLVVDYVLPTSVGNVSIIEDADGVMRLISTSAFVNEPA